MRILIDVTHTSHCYANTGIQRVTRCLYQNIKLINKIIPICFDKYSKSWRKIDNIEKTLMNDFYSINTSKKTRGANWTLSQKIKGYYNKILNLFKTNKNFIIKNNDILLVPEIFHKDLMLGINQVKKEYKNITLIAIFHDAIALDYPELTPKKTVERMPIYMDNLLHFDGIAAISEQSAKQLKNYWNNCEIIKTNKKTPKIEVISLGCEFKKILNIEYDLNKNEKKVPMLLCVSSIEKRKNHITLLKAAKSLWDEGHIFRLKLVGIANYETGKDVINFINELQSKQYLIEWTKSISDEDLIKNYENALFTIYPSLIEGFGLPIIESIFYKKPCICSNKGAISEIAKKGGCLMTNVENDLMLKNCIKTLLTNVDVLQKLILETKKIKIKSWKNYSKEIIDFAIKIGGGGI